MLPRHRDESGATAVEYGLLVAGIAAVLVLVLFVIGRQSRQGFCDTSSTPARGDAVTEAELAAAGC